MQELQFWHAGVGMASESSLLARGPGDLAGNFTLADVHNLVC